MNGIGDRPRSTRRLEIRRFQQTQIFRIRKKETRKWGSGFLRSCFPAFLIRSSVSIRVDPSLDFHASEKSGWKFFCQPVRFDCPITAELDGDLLSAEHSVYAGWEEQPQPAPLGCGLSTSSTSLMPRSMRGPNLPEGIHNHYNSVMIGKKKVFSEKLRFALRVGRSKSREGYDRPITVM